jgi:hypothetical protein
LLTDQDGKSLAPDRIVLVDYSRNSVFYYSKETTIEFNPKVQNCLWAVLPGGKIAVFSPEKFKSVPVSGSYTFQMEMFDVNGKSREEIRNILNLKNHSIQKTEEKEKNPVSTYERTIKMVKLKKEEDFYREEKSEVLYELKGKEVIIDTIKKSIKKDYKLNK